MKKLLCLTLGILTLASCSNDDDSATTPTPENPAPAAGLLRKIEFEDGTGSMVTYDYIYNGNKIVSETSDDGQVAIYTYTGDLITRIESSQDDEPVERNVYEYNSDGNLSTSYYYDLTDSSASKHTYVYNSDGTISVAVYDGNLTSQTELNFTAKIFMTAGEVSKIEEYHTNEGYTTTSTFTFDNKNSYSGNITGLSKLDFDEGSPAGMMHNRLTESVTSTLTPADEYSETSTYTYNSADYPVTEMTSDNGGEDTVTRFYYN